MLEDPLDLFDIKVKQTSPFRAGRGQKYIRLLGEAGTEELKQYEGARAQ